MNSIILRIRKELKINIDEYAKNSVQRFFKEKIKVYGMKTSIVKKISKKYFEEIKDLNKTDILKLCDELFSSKFMEESFIACNWSYCIRKKFEEKDIQVFEKWLKNYVNNWASCDTLCNHTIGSFIEKFPSSIERIKKWTKSNNRWLRRAGAVSLIIPAKKGEFLKEAFEISDSLIKDCDDLVQKGYGWLLKEESRTHQKEVFNYVLKNKNIMPRTALRYAIEKMPKELRIKAMKK
jgi:3-methyladenine DNA glycosylase AlkD